MIINTNAIIYFHSGRNIECNIDNDALQTYTERLYDTDISKVTIVVYNTGSKRQEICNLSSIETISLGDINPNLNTRYGN